MCENQLHLIEENTSQPDIFDIKGFQQFILSNEEWLMERILFYAKRQGYSRYTSTLMEAWRLSISGLSNAFLSFLNSGSEIELSPDDNYANDPAASFGILEAKRHRERGVNLAMFLGLMKYYKQTYMDLIEQAEFKKPYKETCRLKMERFFDRMELGFCTEWCNDNGNNRVKELQNKNRDITNEKNRYLTIFETIHAPVVLIDEENRVENYNQAWAELFEESSVPGSIYYDDNNDYRKVIPWLRDDITPDVKNETSDHVLEKKLVTKKGPKYFQIKIKKLLDVSEKYRGMLIILNDLTELKEAEKDKLHKEKLEGALEMSGAVCHEINQPLQIVLGQTEILKIISKKNEPHQKNLEMIVSQIEKMARITRKLMNITKYETKPYLSRTIIDIEKSSQGK